MQDLIACRRHTAMDQDAMVQDAMDHRAMDHGAMHRGAMHRGATDHGEQWIAAPASLCEIRITGLPKTRAGSWQLPIGTQPMHAAARAHRLPLCSDAATLDLSAHTGKVHMR
jgi:uncharacterized protein involved in copper resistance